MYLDKNKVDAIVIHCSATKEGQDFHVSDIERWHKERGFNSIGYHYVVTLDGKIEKGRPDNQIGAHCSDSGLSGKSYNHHSIGVCYIGGLDKYGNPKDTRTLEQKASMIKLVDELMSKFPKIKEVLGHRDCSKDINKDGRITQNEWVKSCPCFDVKAEFPMSICKSK